MKTLLRISFSVTSFLVIIILNNGCHSSSEKYTPQVYTVTIRDMKFQPAELNVKPADTVVWVNKDLVTHDVTEETNKLWSSGPLPAGKSWRMAVTQNADYFCSIHIVMKGKLNVR